MHYLFELAARARLNVQSRRVPVAAGRSICLSVVGFAVPNLDLVDLVPNDL